VKHHCIVDLVYSNPDINKRNANCCQVPCDQSAGRAIINCNEDKLAVIQLFKIRFGYVVVMTIDTISELAVSFLEDLCFLALAVDNIDWHGAGDPERVVRLDNIAVVRVDLRYWRLRQSIEIGRCHRSSGSRPPTSSPSCSASASRMRFTN
jgi:hypothetical protein